MYNESIFKQPNVTWSQRVDLVQWRFHRRVLPQSQLFYFERVPKARWTWVFYEIFVKSWFSYSASRSIRIWKASSVLVPLNIISGRSRPFKGILPTMSSCCWLSSQNSTPLNFITMGSLGLYTENSEATVMLFCSSGVYTSPIFFGGKGTSWQDVAMQGSRLLGTQVLFHPHSVVNSSWRLPSLEDNWSGVKVPLAHFLRDTISTINLSTF